MAKIGLIDVDSKIPNLALMKISAWHKMQGDDVEFYMDLWRTKYDRIYASKVFTFSSIDINDGFIVGGSGYDLSVTLPDEIEAMYPDYSLYNCDYAIGFITRGCNRHCAFCNVPKKEGKIKKVGNLSDFWKGQTHILLLDNNLTAHPDCIDILRDLQSTNAHINISQGLDLRLMTPEIAVELSKLKRWKRLHFAWDNIREERQVVAGINTILSTGIHQDQLVVYVIIGFDSTPEDDMYRVLKLRTLQVNPYVMPYNRLDKYQRNFARWVNHKAIFKTVRWEDYCKFPRLNATHQETILNL